VSDGILVRDASPEGIELLTRSRRLMFEELDDFAPDVLDRIDSEFDVYLRREFETGRACGWLAFDDATGEWVGGLTNIWVSWPSSPNVPGELRAYLFGLYVAPSYRRRGIARSLVETARQTAREAGAAAVILHASDAGRPLYESLGFAPTSEMRFVFEAE